MNPLIEIYGGVHNDPGSRQRFLEELARQETAPHFVAVEWEKTVFERFSARRPWIEERIRSRQDFLTDDDCHELALAFAWEGDAYAERFPGIDLLWLESGFQEVYLQQQGSNADMSAQSLAESFLYWLSNAYRHSPQPRSKQELIAHMTREMWKMAACSSTSDVDRDARWANAICERALVLRDGWIAVVVGWQHADSQGDHQQLRGLLLSRGFGVNSVCLGP